MFNTSTVLLVYNTSFLRLMTGSQDQIANVCLIFLILQRIRNQCPVCYKKPLIIGILSTIVGGMILYRKATKISVANVRGPPPESFVLGMFPRGFRHEMVVTNSTL